MDKPVVDGIDVKALRQKVLKFFGCDKGHSFDPKKIGGRCKRCGYVPGQGNQGHKIRSVK